MTPTIEAQRRVATRVYGLAADTDGVHAAVTDNGASQTITNGFKGPSTPAKITATAGGTAGDIKAIQVIVNGTAPGGEVIQETLDAFTVNTAGTVTGAKTFATVTSVVIPAHDGTGATTAIGHTGTPAVADTDGILAAVTDDGTEQVITEDIIQPDVPRCITATSGGTAGDIAAIQVTIEGTNAEDVAITEDLPAFTENSATTEVGSKAFKTVTSITIPAHDSTGATTEIGFADEIGIGERLARNTVRAAYLAEVIESTAPTVVVSAATLELNTIELNTTLDSTQVKVEYVPTA
jgi:hypothetical protein